MRQAKPLLLLFARRPSVGTSLPRLRDFLTEGERAGLANAILIDLVEIMRQFDTERAIAYPEGAERSYFLELAPDFELVAQTGNDESIQLTNALYAAFGTHHSPIIVLHDEAMMVSTKAVRHALYQLEQGLVDLVIGSSGSGLYTFFGLAKPAPKITKTLKKYSVTDAISLAEHNNLRVMSIDTPPLIDSFQQAATMREHPDLGLATRAFLASLQTATEH